jgi:uncharacterized protein (TIGR00369 family)
MLDEIRERLGTQTFPICQLLGMEILGVETGKASVQLIVTVNHYNPVGTMHGGIYCDLADMAMGLAFMTTLEKGQSLATVELKMNYFRPVTGGTVRADASVLHRGKTTGYIECDVRDEQGRLVARSASTCMVVPPREPVKTQGQEKEGI